MNKQGRSYMIRMKARRNPPGEEEEAGYTRMIFRSVIRAVCLRTK